MPNIHEMADKHRDEFLALPVETLAGLVLNDVKKQDKPNRGNYCAGFRHKGKDIARAVAEAWGWLEFHGCLALDPDYLTGEVVFVTRRGDELLNSADSTIFVTEELKLKELLHPTVIQKAWGAFIGGQFDSAIFDAMKQVEVSVRAAGGFAASDLGVPLMRRAFSVGDGPLSDPEDLPAEQQALSDLFAGAIGSYKNPHSHRDVVVDRQDALEILTLASHLIGIVESRTEQQEEGQD